jgi:hypothetical protein
MILMQINYNIELFSVRLQNANDILAFIFKDNVTMGVTNKTNYSLKDLKPNTNYAVQIQYVTSHGDSIRSDSTIFRTDDECKIRLRK